MRSVRLTLPAVAVAFALATGTATSILPCDKPVVNVANQAYVAIDCPSFNCFMIGVWIYAESNGNPGLQRGGEGLLFGDADWCQMANPDTLVF